jgi:hypothetical protein
VNSQISIRRLLAIFLIAGLVLAPLARPAMAAASSDASMSAMADDPSMSAIADGCPTKAPMPAGCDKCVFMTACMSSCFAGLSVAAFCPSFATSGRIARLQNDSWPDGLGHPPPEYPPRTLV